MPCWPFYLAVVSVCLLLGSNLWGATLSEQRRELSRAATALRVAERMAESNRNDEAAAAFTEAQQLLARLADGLNDRLARTYERATEQLADTHAKLANAGVAVPPLAKLTPTGSPPPLLGGRGEAEGTQVSFVDHVVPILTAKCGGCHIRGSKGGVVLASYNELLEGAPSGRFVEVGSGMESLLIEVIASGQMPPNGNAVSPAETRVVLTWINQGEVRWRRSRQTTRPAREIRWHQVSARQSAITQTRRSSCCEAYWQ